MDFHEHLSSGLTDGAAAKKEDLGNSCAERSATTGPCDFSSYAALEVSALLRHESSSTLK